MKKLVSFIFILLLATTLYAENSYKTKPNPWSGKPDFILGTDNLEVVNLNSSGTVTGLIVDAQRVENSSGTLTFNDPTTGVKTLAQLAAGGSGESTSVADTATINLTMVGTEITADGLYTAGDFITLTGADYDVDTAAVGNGDTTHVPTCDGVYDFCETTQVYYNATADLDADLQDLADGSLTASKVAGVADADYGDVGVSSGAWSVENDSHDHSAAGSTVTINAADITDKNAGTDITADLEEEVTEGSLADSTIVSGDIKDGTIAGGDLATNIAITTTGLTTANGNLKVGNANTTAGVLTLLEDTDDGSNYASFTVPALTDNTVYTLPADDGGAGEQLQTNGSGVLSWEAAGSFDSTSVEATTWGAGGNASNIWSFNLSGTDTTLTWGSAAATFSHKLGIGATPWEQLTVSGGDAVISDTSPHLTLRDSSDNTAYQWHCDTADSTWGYLQLWRGTDDGTGFSVTPSTPLIYFDTSNNVGFGFGFIGILDAGGATSLEVPNGADKDITVAGQISFDTDGANETGDCYFRAFDGTNQYPVGRKLVTVADKYINAPDLLDDPDLVMVWHNTSGMTFTITEWKAWSDTDNVSLAIEELTDMTDFTALTTVDAVEIATNGTSVFYASDATITHATIEHDHTISLDFDQTDTPKWVHIVITGWFNANVD